MTRHSFSRRACISILATGLVTLASAPSTAGAASHATPTAPTFSIRGLGPPFFGDSYTPNGLNDTGTVAGTDPSGSVPQGFFFAKGTVHSVTPPTAMSGISINGLNNADDVAAEGCFAAGCGTTRAYTGKVGATTIAWKSLPPPAGSSVCSISGCDSSAAAIATNGYAVGQYGGQATMWVPGSKPSYSAKRLPYTQASTFSSSSGTAADSFGDVAGVEERDLSTVGAFWPRKGAPVLLPACQEVLVRGGATFEKPLGLMATGTTKTRTVTIVGQCLVESSTDQTGFAPCLWVAKINGSATQLSGPVRLDANAGSDGGGAVAMNQKGWIVGNQGDATSSPTLWINRDAFLLSSLIPANSGWQMDTLYAVNKKGQITGVGSNAGGTQAFLLTPR